MQTKDNNTKQAATSSTTSTDIPPQQLDQYWTVSSGVAVRNGWSCRECKKAIVKGEQIKVRDGRKLRLMYHEKCFSGDADPRTQIHSSFSEGRLPRQVFQDTAPKQKGCGKWSTSSYGYNPTG